MKIVQLSVSRFARLKAVEIRPAGPLVKVTGVNDQGKSTVLRAIWTALKGRTAAPPRPIHEGAEEAIIKLDLGALKITRRFRRTDDGEVTTDLSIVDEDGGKVRKSPQAVIDALLGDLSFDPLAFARMSGEDQYAKLRALVPGVDFEKLSRERAAYYTERTIANRDQKRFETLAREVVLPEGPEPAAVNVGDAVMALGDATERNSRRTVKLAEIQATRNRAADLKLQAEHIREQAARMLRDADNLIARSGDLSAEADEEEQNLPAKIDVGALQGTIAGAELVDAVRKKFAAKRSHEASAEAALRESDRLSEAIVEVDRRAAEAIAAAKLPAGLSLDPNRMLVLLNGAPLAEAGTANKIVASAEVAMFLNPDLRVMLIDEGSELDREHLAALEEIAGARDYQVWVARVEEGEGGVGFRIEDGMVAGSTSGAISDAAVEASRRKPR